MYVNERVKKVIRVKDHELRTGCLRLDMNENPEGLPEEFVRNAAERITPELISAYPRKEELIRLIAEKEGLNEDCLSITNGSEEGIRLIFETFTKPGGQAVMVSPTFEMYRIYGEIFGVQIDVVEFDEDFHVSTEEIIKRINSETQLVILLNPNSPIGGAYTDREFAGIIEKAEETGALVVIDEAYYPFGVDTKIPLIKKYDNVVVLRTFSKLCSMAGLRVGFAAASEGIIGFIENAQSTYNVNSVGILFAEEFLKRADLWDRLTESQEEGRNFLTGKLEQFEYEYEGIQGNFILIKPRIGSHLAAQKLKEQKILVKTYGSQLLKPWIRVTIGSKKVMEQFWKEFQSIEGI